MFAGPVLSGLDESNRELLAIDEAQFDLDLYRFPESSSVSTSSLTIIG